METLAIVLLATPLAVFAGYPLILFAAAAFAPGRRVRVAPLPPVSILISAYNEAPRIGPKLDSVLAALAAYPGGGEVIVGDDGSADGTADVVARYGGVRLVRRGRGGKAAVLNALAPLARHDVLVLTDADPLFDADTLWALTAPFADPHVGAVAGAVEVIRSKASRFAAADRAFRAYESAMRAAEDRLFGCVSADGGLFAIRAALMPTVPGNVTDDFHVSTAAVAAGHRIAWAPRARVHEHSIPGSRQQFRRRVRITVRGLTALWVRRSLMNPARTGWYALGLVAHKLARRLAPLTLVPLWIVAGLLGAQGHVFWALICAALTALALAGAVGAMGRRLPRGLSALQGAALHLAGLATGVALFAAGRRYVQWTPQKA